MSNREWREVGIAAPVSLTDYLNRKNPKPEPKQPEWIRRKNAQGLPLQVEFRIKRPDGAA